MPSYRVTESTASIGIFDLIGQDGVESGFIAHTGLAETSGSHEAASMPVLDMGPPLRGEGGQIKADVVGTATLTDDEAHKIRTFVDRHASEHQAFLHVNMGELIKAAPQIYCILPHASPYREDDGRYARMRFSCAGFAFEAYVKARIDLFDADGLPTVDFDVIRSAYPAVGFMERGLISREALGLEGSGPWPVMLCGYLFHALNRDADEVRREPYTPAPQDRYFV